MTLPTSKSAHLPLVGSNEEIGKEVNQVKLQAVTLNARVWRQIEGIPLTQAKKLMEQSFSPAGYVHTPATGTMPEMVSLLFDLTNGKYRRLSVRNYGDHYDEVVRIIKDKDLPQIFIT